MYTYMPTSKLKLGPLRVPGLGTRIEANSIQLHYDSGDRYDFGSPQSRSRMSVEFYYCNKTAEKILVAIKIVLLLI